MKRIETSKGLWEVVEINSIQQGQFYVDTLSSEHYKLSEMTEEQASEIVEIHKNWQPAEEFYVDYFNYGCIYSNFETALESLHSLLESQGIEITQNTYIFKV